MRPTILHVNGILYWTIRTYNPDTLVLKDADSTPTVAVRKNGASTGDSVTITKRSATTGIYDCSYDPASEIEGDEFAIEESATITGTTTSQATYSQSWSFTMIAVERGTDNAALAATALSTAVWTSTIAGRIDVDLSSLATAASITAMRGADNDTLKTLSDQIDGTATAANQTKTLDRLGYLMAQEIGACADAGTSAESYTITIDTTTYTIDHTGLDATGNRGTATLTKS